MCQVGAPLFEIDIKDDTKPVQTTQTTKDTHKQTNQESNKQHTT